MKKLLSILSSIGLVAVTSTNVVSCSKKFNSLEPSVDTIMNTVTFKVNLDFKTGDNLNNSSQLPYKIVSDADNTKDLQITRFYIDDKYLDNGSVKEDVSQVETFITFSVANESLEVNKTVYYDLVNVNSGNNITKIKIIGPHKFSTNSRMIVNAYSPTDVVAELDDWNSFLGIDNKITYYVDIVNKQSGKGILLNNPLSKDLINNGGKEFSPKMPEPLDKNLEYDFRIYHNETDNNKEKEVNDYLKIINFLY